MLPSFAFKRLTKFLEQNILESLMSNNLHPRIKNCEHVVCVLVPRVPEKVLMRGLANLWSKSPAIIDTIKVTTPATARRRTTIKAKHRKNCECCPLSQLIVRQQRLSWIQLLNCQNCNQCLKCHKSLDCLCHCLCCCFWLFVVKIVKNCQ